MMFSWSRKKLSKDEMSEAYARYSSVVFRRARTLLGNDNDAWDLVQQVFEKIWVSGDQFRGDSAPMTYLYRVTTNLAFNQLRQSRTHEAAHSQLPEMTEVFEPLEQKNASDFLRKLADVLSPREWEVLTLYHVDELPQEEIAQVLGLSRKTIGRELAAIHARAQGLLKLREEKVSDD